jgi:hypothetical protein
MGTLHEDQHTFLSHLTQFFLELEILKKSCRENENKHFMNNYFFFFENCASYKKTCKNCGAWPATDENMAHARCMLDT